MISQIILAAALALGQIPVASAGPEDAPTNAANHPEARPFDAARDADQDVDDALVRAEAAGKNVLLVMGANWCHDSRALAGWFETPRFETMLGPKYEVVYVDVGQKDHNIQIARRFGLKTIKGTPTVLVIGSESKLRNKKTAATWRNAASRSEDAIFGYFDDFKVE